MAYQTSQRTETHRSFEVTIGLAENRHLDGDDDRHRAVVDQLDRHPRAEDAGGDLDVQLAESHAEGFAERFCLVGRRCPGEARAVALCRIVLSSEVNSTMRGSE